MDIRKFYLQARPILGAIALCIAVVAILCAMFVDGPTYSEAETKARANSFTHNMAFVLLILWLVTGGVSKMVMASNSATYQLLNISALLLLGFAFVMMGRLSPSSLAPTNTGWQVYSFLVDLFTYLWVVFDVAEIIFPKRTEES